jgi:hypothetical protein
MSLITNVYFEFTLQYAQSVNIVTVGMYVRRCS